MDKGNIIEVLFPPHHWQVSLVCTLCASSLPSQVWGWAARVQAQQHHLDIRIQTTDC